MSEKIQKIIDYFHSELKQSQLAKDYLKSRGVSKESIIQFKLGYAPPNCKIAARFHDRIIFPIWDPYGNPIGWTGRTLIDAPAKYVNVKESPEFQKGRVLYLYNIAKRAIAASKWAILVEGQMDAIALHQYGLKNTVAASGTAFKTAAANILARYAQQVYVIFDSDEAGEKAKIKATKFLKEAGVDVFIVNIPAGEDDPDHYIRTYGKQSFLELLKNASKQ
jgi:DNA primase